MRPLPLGVRLGVTALLVVLAVVLLMPFIWVVFGSFRTTGDILANPGAIIPREWTLDNFVELFTERGFGGYLVNSLIVSIAVVLGNIVLSSLVGYALAKLQFRGKRLITIATMISLMVPYVSIFIPQFLVTVQLNLVNTLAGIILPSLVLPIAVFVVSQFGQSVPDEIIEAARLDGAGEWRIFLEVFLPVIRPALATVAVLTFLAAWNNFLWPLVVAQTAGTYTLPVGLALVTQQARTIDYGMLLAAAMVLVVPILVLFLFLQKQFVQGVATTGLK